MIVVTRIGEEITSAVHCDKFRNDFHKSHIPCEDFRLKAGIHNATLYVKNNSSSRRLIQRNENSVFVVLSLYIGQIGQHNFHVERRRVGEKSQLHFDVKTS